MWSRNSLSAPAPALLSILLFFLWLRLPLQMNISAACLEKCPDGSSSDSMLTATNQRAACVTLDPFHVDCAARVKDGDNPGPDAQRLWSAAQRATTRRPRPSSPVSARPSNPAMEFSGKNCLHTYNSCGLNWKRGHADV